MFGFHELLVRVLARPGGVRRLRRTAGSGAAELVGVTPGEVRARARADALVVADLGALERLAAALLALVLQVRPPPTLRLLCLRHGRPPNHPAGMGHGTPLGVRDQRARAPAGRFEETCVIAWLLASGRFVCARHVRGRRPLRRAR